MAIKMAVNLAEGGPIYSLFVDPPIQPSTDFRLYAIKNPREVLRGGKMTFDVKGPYKFKISPVRLNRMFSEGGQKLQFDSGQKLALLEDQPFDLDERIWLLNPVVVSTMSSIRLLAIDRIPFLRLAEPMIYGGVSLLLEQFDERLITRTSPRQILMGRKVVLLESLTNLADRLGLASLIPAGLPQNTFGLAFVQNETLEHFELWTGVGKTRDKFGEVSKWRRKPVLDAWRGKCKIIRGTNGEIFKSSLQQGQDIRVFMGPFCRSTLMTPTAAGSVITKSGIRALEYEIDPKLFLSPRTNPVNECFCENTKAYNCRYDGLMTMGPCFFNTPLFLSRGNLKDVEKRAKRFIDIKSIERQPVPDAQTFAIEPITGAALEVNLTITGLFSVIRQPYARDLSKVQNLTFAPLFAATVTVILDFETVWPIYYLQLFYDYHKPIMAATATTGFGLLALKFLL